jgi:hypothetical protein
LTASSSKRRRRWRVMVAPQGFENDATTHTILGLMRAANSSNASTSMPSGPEGTVCTVAPV